MNATPRAVIDADITAETQDQLALRISEQRHARALEAADHGLWEWNLATNQLFVSPPARRLLGIAEAAQVSNVGDLLAYACFHPDDRHQVEETIRWCLSHGSGGFEIEYRVAEVRGAVRWIRSRGKIFLDAAGCPKLVTGALTDITARKEAEEKLQLSEQRRGHAQRLEAVGTLAGGIAHNFNNILGAILGYGEMAMREAPAGTRLRQDLESIVIAGERGRALVDRVLTFSHSGAAARIPIYVEQEVRTTLDGLAATLPVGVTIEANLIAGRAAILGEPTQINQIVMNLVSNAVQAMPTGGKLRISLTTQSFQAERVVTVGTVAAATYLVLEVVDSGAGMPPWELQRIFEPFFTTKEVNVGNGLGLSLVHGIVVGMGGAIDVISTPGCGSIFTVYLPRAGEVPAPCGPGSDICGAAEPLMYSKQ